MSEQWKPVQGFEGIYEVSDWGRVRRVAGGRGAQIGRFLRLAPHWKCGHLYATFSRDGKRRKRYVHRLVALLFIGPPPSPGHQVRHLDGNAANNHWTNLAWGTQADNEADKVRHGRDNAGMRSAFAKLTDDQIVEARGMLKAGVTQREIAEQFGINQSTVSRLAARRTWRCVA